MMLWHSVINLGLYTTLSYAAASLLGDPVSSASPPILHSGDVSACAGSPFPYLRDIGGEANLFERIRAQVLKRNPIWPSSKAIS